jgi:methyltransferase
MIPLPVTLFALALVPMLAETARSVANEARLRSRGAVEPRGDVYPLMLIAYPACFFVMIVESELRGATYGRAFGMGLAVFVAAKALKYWAIATLGPRWTFRVLVLPGAALIAAGPYRLMRHPNYVGVCLELVGMAIMARAFVTGPLAVGLFGALMAARVRVEDRALGRR